MTIEWDAFLRVFLAALIGATSLVFFYAAGLRLLVRAGKVPVRGPVEFTDAIAVITDKERERAARHAAKAAKKSPLSPAQRKLAFVAACACFVVCAGVVVFGIGLIVLNH